jgi:hypothetical protein
LAGRHLPELEPAESTSLQPRDFMAAPIVNAALRPVRILF